MHLPIGNDDAITFIVKDLMTDKFGLNDQQLDLDASFGDDLGIDSLDVFELISDLEKKFHIAIQDEDAEQLLTPRDVILFIKKGLL